MGVAVRRYRGADLPCDADIGIIEFFTALRVIFLAPVFLSRQCHASAYARKD